MLDQQIVGDTSLDAFKNGLDTIGKTKMGFFVDCSSKLWASLAGCPTGEAILGELLGELYRPTLATNRQIFTEIHLVASWCSGRVSDSWSRGRGFESRPGTTA